MLRSDDVFFPGSFVYVDVKCFVFFFLHDFLASAPTNNEPAKMDVADDNETLREPSARPTTTTTAQKKIKMKNHARTFLFTPLI